MGTKNSSQQYPSEPVASEDMPRELVAGAPLEDYLPYQLFRIANRLTLNLRDDLRPVKMTLARWRTLSVLTASDGRRMGELAAYMVIEQPALSRIVDQMERDGLVTRRLADEDSRVVRVYLTTAGRDMFEKIRPLELRHYQRAIDGFKKTELRKLSELLQRLSGNIER